MASTLLCDPLLLSALVLLCLLVPGTVAASPPRAPTTPLAPQPRRRRRAKGPEPFAGLIYQPRCALGASVRVSRATAIARTRRARAATATTHLLSASCPARGCARAAHPVLQGWVEAAAPLRAFAAHYLHALQITQRHLDDLSAVRSAGRDGERSAAEAVAQRPRAPHGVWTAIDPETPLRLRLQGGNAAGRWHKLSCIQWCRAWRRAVCHSCGARGRRMPSLPSWPTVGTGGSHLGLESVRD
jgi:hypothetical protein